VLLAHVLGVERAALLAHGALSDPQVARFRELVRSRVDSGRPVAYLVGRRGFLDLDLFVDERVLVPRPETEHVFEVLLEVSAAGRLPDGPVVDRGTGSGALALGLAKRLARPVIGVDLSAAALEVAVLNRERCAGSGIGRVVFVRADCLTCFADRSLAAVVANPPYIEEAEFAVLPEDVRRHEPRMALVPDGGCAEDHYARLIQESSRVLVDGGWLVTEVGQGQASRVAAQLREAHWDPVTITKDLAGIGRVVSARVS
jgi:release factor glutamine methyltransferase